MQIRDPCAPKHEHAQLRRASPAERARRAHAANRCARAARFTVWSLGGRSFGGLKRSVSRAVATERIPPPSLSLQTILASSASRTRGTFPLHHMAGVCGRTVTHRLELGFLDLFGKNLDLLPDDPVLLLRAAAGRVGRLGQTRPSGRPGPPTATNLQPLQHPAVRGGNILTSAAQPAPAADGSYVV